ADLYDAVLIIVIVVMNAILGFVQEYRAERSLEALKNLAAPKAHVLREGGIVAVPSRELVPGDVAVLTAGDRIPADARLFEVASLISLIGVLRDPGHIELLFLTAVGLAVAAIPEGLPAIVTISLALGLQRMIRRGALIRKLPAVEALGAASVICSDKTGTLTKGEMNVRVLGTGTVEYEVIGEGFDPTGTVRTGGRVADLTAHPGLQQLLECGVLCNDAVLRQEGTRWILEGDPTEGALLVAARRAGMDPTAIRARWPRVAEIAFTSERKKMSTLHAQLPESEVGAVLSLPEGERLRRLAGVPAILHVKGAPERILASCSHHIVDGERRPLSEYDRSQYQFRNQELATRAFRVIGHAV